MVMESALQMIFARTHNIQSLELWLMLGRSAERPLSALPWLFPATMPALQRLELGEASGSLPTSDWHSLRPDREQCPCLLDLCLTNVHFQWDLPIFSTLRSLELSYVELPPTTVQFFQILQTCSQLEILNFWQPMSDRSLFSEPLIPVDAAVLPCLRLLDIQGSAKVVSFVFDRLSVPSTCTIRSVHEFHYTGERDVEPITTVLPRQRIFRDLVYRVSSLSLLLAHHIGGIMRIGFETYDGASCKLTVSTNVRGMLGIDMDAWKALLDTFAGSPCSHFRLEYLSIQVVTTDMWRLLLLRLPLLETIYIRHHPADSGGELNPLLEALRARKEGSDELHAACLRKLRLEFVRVDDVGAHGLVSVVEMRASYGIPLTELVLCNSSCTRKVDRDAFIY
ncbi:hypothetical protein BD414DRAFT_154742 [Trametes punicea]|nr:hypothetical protein BD414DRAFT_154742 [Trametes punicea]